MGLSLTELRTLRSTQQTEQFVVSLGLLWLTLELKSCIARILFSATLNIPLQQPSIIYPRQLCPLQCQRGCWHWARGRVHHVQVQQWLNISLSCTLNRGLTFKFKPESLQPQWRCTLETHSPVRTHTYWKKKKHERSFWLHNDVWVVNTVCDIWVSNMPQADELNQFVVWKLHLCRPQIVLFW